MYLLTPLTFAECLLNTRDSSRSSPLGALVFNEKKNAAKSALVWGHPLEHRKPNPSGITEEK